MRLTVPIFAAALLLAGCYDSSFGEKAPATDTPRATTTIRELQALFTGETVAITGDIVVAGCITTSDRSRNFYRTLCIQQDGAGLEIMAGLDHLHNDYPIGTLVSVRLRGFALGAHYGVLQIGRKPAPGSGFATDYIASQPALDNVLIRSVAIPEPFEPAQLGIPELTPAMCGTLVRIDRLHYRPEDLTAGTWAGYKRFTDPDGHTVYTYVRAYADFADEEVPAGECALVGILQYDPAGDGRYLLKLRDENDCMR